MGWLQPNKLFQKPICFKFTTAEPKASLRLIEIGLDTRLDTRLDRLDAEVTLQLQ